MSNAIDHGILKQELIRLKITSPNEKLDLFKTRARWHRQQMEMYEAEARLIENYFKEVTYNGQHEKTLQSEQEENPENIRQDGRQDSQNEHEC